MVGLLLQQPAVERHRARDVLVAAHRVRQPADQLVGVAVVEAVGVAPLDGADGNVLVAVGGVDGVDGGDRHRVRDIRDDPEEPHLALVVQDVGDADRGGVVPPPRQVGVDDHARAALGLPAAARRHCCGCLYRRRDNRRDCHNYPYRTPHHARLAYLSPPVHSPKGPRVSGPGPADHAGVQTEERP